MTKLYYMRVFCVCLHMNEGKDEEKGEGDAGAFRKYGDVFLFGLLLPV